MEVKPGYKQTEVGVIPEDWEASTVGENSKWMSGGTPRRNNSEFWSGTIPWISGSTLKTVEISTSDQFLTADAVAAGSKMAPVDSTLLLVRGSALHNEIRAGLVVLPIAFNQDVKALVPNATVEPKFLTYYILAQSNELLALVSSAGNSAGVLDTALVQHYKFLKPPLPEQRAIAAVLSDVDALLAKLDQLIAKKCDLKQAAMQQLLTGQIRLPGFSGEWEVKRFCEFAMPRKDRVDPRKAGCQEFCVELEHIEQGSGRLAGSGSTGEESSLKSVFHPGDVLFGKLRAYLRKYWLADRPGVCSTEIWVLVANRSYLSPEFLFQLVTTDKFIETASTAYGTHMPRSDWNVVKNYEMALPKPEEQTAIATILADMDAEFAALETRRDKTRALKQGMMQELLTGRIRLV